MRERPLIELIEQEDKKSFYQSNIFHERQMNSCPIGCQGCAVSAVTNARGGLTYRDILSLYKEAHDLGVSLKITKVEGYDPVFVNYSDSPETAFAQTIVDAVDHGHQIITPICTTGAWKSEKTKWQIEELGKLANKYRYYQYPSGNSGVGFVLSVPREIRLFNKNYDYQAHIEKLVLDIEMLSKGGNLDVLIYFNSNLESDRELAENIKFDLDSQLSHRAKANANLLITDFNSETIPESCYRYTNSVLVSDKGFFEIDKEKLEWEVDPNVINSQEELAMKLATV